MIIMAMECVDVGMAHAQQPGSTVRGIDISSCVSHIYSSVFLYKTCNHDSVLDVGSFEYCIEHSRRLGRTVCVV